MKKEEARTVCLYDLDHTLAKPLLEQCEYPWEALPRIRDLILELGSRLPESEYEKRGETVWVHKTARVFESAYLGENIIIEQDHVFKLCGVSHHSALTHQGIAPQESTVAHRVEVGCGSILNPGTVIGRDSNIYPLSSVRGCVDKNSIYKKQGEVAEKHD